MPRRHLTAVLLTAMAGLAQTAPDTGVFMLSGGAVHTISGPVIENGSVLVRDGKIIGVGRGLQAPEGATVIDIRGRHVYPGMIDSAGISGPDNLPGDETPLVHANGVTLVMLAPRDDLLAGQISVAGTSGLLHLRFPAIVTTPIPTHESFGDDEEPVTAIAPEPVSWTAAKKDRDDKLRALNRFFDDARRYRRARSAGSRRVKEDARFEALLPVLDGLVPLLVTAVREREIREAIAFADKQKIHIILADACESYKAIPLIRSHDIPVILGPPLSLPLNEDDAYDRSYTTAGELSRAGIRFSIGTFSARQSRNLPYQAAAAVAFGLPHDEAYKAISLNAAIILGLSKKLGSIDEGKAADLIVTDGDPLETTTHITQVFIDGKPVSLETRQKQLYEQFAGRP